VLGAVAFWTAGFFASPGRIGSALMTGATPLGASAGIPADGPLLPQPDRPDDKATMASPLMKNRFEDTSLPPQVVRVNRPECSFRATGARPFLAFQ
jgi:hypothetical protein